jgi:hypothetical protein
VLQVQCDLHRDRGSVSEQGRRANESRPREADESLRVVEKAARNPLRSGCATLRTFSGGGSFRSSRQRVLDGALAWSFAYFVAYFVACFVALARDCRAHEAGAVYVRLRIDGTSIVGEIDVARRDALLLLSLPVELDDGQAMPLIASRGRELSLRVGEGLEIRSDSMEFSAARSNFGCLRISAARLRKPEGAGAIRALRQAKSGRGGSHEMK